MSAQNKGSLHVSTGGLPVVFSFLCNLTAAVLVILVPKVREWGHVRKWRTGVMTLFIKDYYWLHFEKNRKQ